MREAPNLTPFIQDIRLQVQHAHKHYAPASEIALKLQEAHKLLIEAEILMEKNGTVPS